MVNVTNILGNAKAFSSGDITGTITDVIMGDVTIAFDVGSTMSGTITDVIMGDVNIAFDVGSTISGKITDVVMDSPQWETDLRELLEIYQEQ